MTSPAKAPLYSPQLLALAVELADNPFDPDAPFIGEARSRSCGSSLLLSCDPSFEHLGMKVTACAVGQAAAAIFARHAATALPSDPETIVAQIERWLVSEGETPDWPQIDLLSPARDYPGRHGAILLPWRAAVDALSKHGAGR